MGSAKGLRAAFWVVLWGMSLFVYDRALALDTVADYSKSPAFVTKAVQPLTMLLLDNTGSMANNAYQDYACFDSSGNQLTAYGIFDNNKCDNNGDGNKDCGTGSNISCKAAYDPTKSYYGLFENSTTTYYYHPKNYSGALSICEYTPNSGKCSLTASVVGDCTYPGSTCTTNDRYYTCYRAAGTSGPYASSSDCTTACAATGGTCTTATHTCDKAAVPAELAVPAKYVTGRPVYDPIKDSTTKNNKLTANICDGTVDNKNTNECTAAGFTGGTGGCTSAYACYSGATRVAALGPYGNASCDDNATGVVDACKNVNASYKCQLYASAATPAPKNDYLCYTPAVPAKPAIPESHVESAGACPSSTCTGTGLCNPKTFTCTYQQAFDGKEYLSTICDADGDAKKDCASLYDCVVADTCRSGNNSNYTYAGTYPEIMTPVCNSACTSNNCKDKINTTVSVWSGKTQQSCTDIHGSYSLTGKKIIVDSYNCNATSGTGKTQCDNLGGTCTDRNIIDTCEWYDDLLVRKACRDLYLPPTGTGTCVDDDHSTDPKKQTTCDNALDPDNSANCTNKYGSTCSTPPAADGTLRAPYWTKTPADGTNAVGWNCTTSDCVAGTVTPGRQLNHDLMTQMDVAKKVLIGGKTAPYSHVPGTIELDGDFDSKDGYYTCVTGGKSYTDPWCDQNDSNHSKITCVNGSNCNWIEPTNNGNIVLQKLENPKGILQNFDSLTWGYAVLNKGSLADGGIVENYVGTRNADIVKSINETVSGNSTDLAESLNTVVNYFKQAPTEYSASEYSRNNTWDPFFDKPSKSLTPCGRGSVILITDGEANEDNSLNADIANYAGDYNTAAATAGKISDFVVGSTPGTKADFFVDDVSFWAHTHDLRPEASMGGDTGMEGQRLDIYSIYAFGNNATVKANMKKAAVLGGFDDKDKNGRPNTVAEEQAVGSVREWDFDKDGVADNFAEASDGEKLADKLQSMLGQIQQKAAAGSAASVISASRSGEGAIFQAVFFAKTPPDSTTDKNSITWVGDVHALWVDEYGNIRMDCSLAGDTCGPADGIFDPIKDRIVEFYADPISAEAMVRIFKDDNGDSRYISGLCDVTLAKGPYDAKEFDCTSVGGNWTYPKGTTTDFVTTVRLKDFSNYIWSGGRWLGSKAKVGKDESNRTYTSLPSGTASWRYIFTQKEDSITGKPVLVPFTTDATLGLKGFFTGTSYEKYFGVADSATADKIVNYVRGVNDPATGFRSRQYDWGWGDDVVTNRLGDIVGSTPTIVARPAEDYDLLYLDKSYQRFRQRYDKRRVMIYTGANDGGLHAFNGGYYDRSTKSYLPGPSGKTQYTLGSEMWMFIPQNLLPHLQWLTKTTYAHAYYVDMKPYAFDAKIFTPEVICSTKPADSGCIHPDGWGTVLVGGMGFGGGDFNIDLDGNAATGPGGKEKYLRSAYYILDVTNPESEPVVLSEFTDSTGSLGFTTSTPTAIPMLLCDRRTSGSCPANTGVSTTWPMDWYLAFGSGPHDSSSPQTALLGKSDQEAKVYVLKLGGTTVLSKPTLEAGFPKTIPVGITKPTGFTNSFFTDMIAVDYNLDFKTDVVYFGSIANAISTSPKDTKYTGAMHRLVTGGVSTPSTWTLNTMFNANQPVSSAASASWDGSRAWVYFGTGRLLEPSGDKNDIHQQSYYGLKESYDLTGTMDLGSMTGANLVDVSNVWVENTTGLLRNIADKATPAATANAAAVMSLTGGGTLPASIMTFKQLNEKMYEDSINGWKIDFPTLKERNLGQAAVLGEIVSFTSYIPSAEACTGEGESALWAAYYRTGTAYSKPVIGVGSRGGKTENLRKIGSIKGMTLTPSLHSGAESGTKAMIQTSTGAIINIDQAPPGIVKSGVISWRDKGAD